jgi:hypothetical protein
VADTVYGTDHNVGLWEQFVKPSIAILPTAVVKKEAPVEFLDEISKMRGLPKASPDIEHFFSIEVGY